MRWGRREVEEKGTKRCWVVVLYSCTGQTRAIFFPGPLFSFLVKWRSSQGLRGGGARQWRRAQQGVGSSFADLASLGRYFWNSWFIYENEKFIYNKVSGRLDLGPPAARAIWGPPISVAASTRSRRRLRNGQPVGTLIRQAKTATPRLTVVCLATHY